MNYSSDEMRVKVFSILREELLFSFTRKSDFRCLSVPQFEGLPEDVRVMEVHATYDPPGFDFVIWHESFEPVEPSERLPRIRGQLRPAPVSLVRQEDGSYRTAEDHRSLFIKAVGPIEYTPPLLRPGEVLNLRTVKPGEVVTAQDFSDRLTVAIEHGFTVVDVHPQEQGSWRNREPML